MKECAKKLYSGLEVKEDICTGCEECANLCPCKLQVTEKVRKAHLELK